MRLLRSPCPRAVGRRRAFSYARARSIAGLRNFSDCCPTLWLCGEVERGCVCRRDWRAGEHVGGDGRQAITGQVARLVPGRDSTGDASMVGRSTVEFLFHSGSGEGQPARGARAVAARCSSASEEATGCDGSTQRACGRSRTGWARVHRPNRSCQSARPEHLRLGGARAVCPLRSFVALDNSNRLAGR